GGGAVPPLLDVGGVGAAHQHGAHLLGDPGERAHQHRERDPVHQRWSPTRCSPRRPPSPPRAPPPGRSSRVASANSTTAGPSSRSPPPSSSRASTATSRQVP